MDPIKKERQYKNQMDLFLMGICHQSYSEIAKIPLTKQVELMEAFRVVVEALCNTKGGKKEIMNVIKGITDPNEYIKLIKEKRNEPS